MGGVYSFVCVGAGMGGSSGFGGVCVCVFLRLGLSGRKFFLSWEN
jgi:hypothetical protein